MSTTAAATAGAGATAVILGATGAVGKPLLAQLVSETSPYTSVYSFARRNNPSPPPVSSKVEFKEVIVDFESLYDGNEAEKAKFASIPAASAVFITMGTTRAAAGSMAAFEKIDRGYVLASAKALLQPSNPATLVYCSSGSSSSSSLFPYLKSKGLTEEGLANLYEKCIILRPGFLQNAERPQLRLMEKAVEPLMNLASKFSGSLAAPVGDVAKAMLRAAQKGPAELKKEGLGEDPGKSFRVEEGKSREAFVVVGNPAVLKLARDQA
ncbi:uncharacterized protein UHOD_01527 [Ustilago sp. UG-2017b]|nr:uncharacterized protein UHOD_01527 [Ustilago sp. UG-2017b]